jgi:hypothetical protein
VSQTLDAARQLHGGYPVRVAHASGHPSANPVFGN